MRLLPALAMPLLLAMPGVAAAEPLLCHWVERLRTTVSARALGQDGRVREFASDAEPAPDEVLRRLGQAEPSGEAVGPELMARLRSLAAAAAKGPYRDAPGARNAWMLARSTLVACGIGPAAGQPRPATVVLRECHNSRHINVAASAPELLSYLTNLISPKVGQTAMAEDIIQALHPCF